MAKKKRQSANKAQRAKLQKWIDKEAGDAVVACSQIGMEVLLAADILNRLRLAEQIATGEDMWGTVVVHLLDKFMLDDTRDALLFPDEMARLPVKLIREQRMAWEEEVARFAAALDAPALHSRLVARLLRHRALRTLAEGDAANVKRTSTYAKIADELRLKGRDRERQVRRILREHSKAEGGVFAVDRRLLRRELKDLSEFYGRGGHLAIPEWRSVPPGLMSEPDEIDHKSVLKPGRK